MRLVVQTNIAGRISVWLIHGNQILARGQQQVVWHGADRALLLVDRVVRQARVRLVDLRGIVVVRGPGSFTAVRVGIIIGNTLGQLLAVPLYGIVRSHELTDSEALSVANMKAKRSTRLLPWYGKMPNITRPTQATAKR